MSFASDIDYETPLAGGVLRGMDFLNRGISGLAGAAPGEATPLPVLGDTGPSDKTSADQWLPAIARQVIDNFIVRAAPGLQIGAVVAGAKPEQVSLQEQHVQERANELLGQYEGIGESDAQRIARLENAYNTLGGTLMAGTAAALGFTGAGIVVAATATAGVTAAGFLASEEQVARGEQRLPAGSIGREIANIAVPEAAVLQPLLISLKALRLRTAAHMVVDTADDFTATAQAGIKDLEAVARAADEQAARAVDPRTVREATELRDEAIAEADALRRQTGIETPTETAQAIEGVQAFLRAQPVESTKSMADQLTRAYELADRRIARVLSRMTPTASPLGAKVKVSKSGKTLVNEVEQIIADLQGVAQRAGVPLPQEHFDALLRLRDAVRAEEMNVSARNIAVGQGKKAAREETRAAKTAHGKAETAAVNTKAAAERAGGSTVNPAALEEGLRAAARLDADEYRKLLADAVGGDEIAKVRVREIEAARVTAAQREVTEATDEELLAATRGRPDIELIDEKGRVNHVAEELVRRGLADKVREVGNIDIARVKPRGAVATAEGRRGVVYEREELRALRQRANSITESAEDVESAQKGVAKAEAKGDQRVADAEAAGEREQLSIVSRADKEKTRLEITAARNEDRLASVRERTDRLLNEKRTKTLVDGVDVDGVRTGYVRPDDEAVLAKTLIHTGRHDSETFGRWMREFVEQNPDKVARAEAMTTQQVTDLVEKIATNTGVDRQALTAGVDLQRGEVTARLYLGDLVLSAKTTEWAQLGAAVLRGDAFAEDLAKLTADLSDFTNSLTEGVSEIGRALWSRRLIAKDQAVTLIRTDSEVRHTENVLRLSAKRLADADAKAAAVRTEVTSAQKGVEDRAAAEIAATAEQREAAKGYAAAKTDVERTAAQTRLDEAHANLQALTTDRVSFTEGSRTRISAAEAKVDEAIAAHEAALQAHEQALARASDAYSAMRETIVRNQAKLQLTAQDLTVLAQMDPTNTTGLINWLKTVRGEKKPLAVVNAWLVNSLYGNPISLAVNAYQTFGTLVMNELLEPLVRAGAGKLVANRLGEPVFNTQKVAQRARMFGAWDAIPEMWRGMSRLQLEGDAITTELRWGIQSVSDQGTDALTGLGRRSVAPGKRGLLVEGALRTLRASDLGNRLWSTGAESRDILVLMHSRQGTEAVGAAIAGLKNGQERYIKIAAKTQAAATFNDVIDTGARRKFLDAIGIDWKGLRPGLILIPAARFGFAWTRAGLEATPLGMLKGVQRARAAEKLTGIERVAEGRVAARQMNNSAIGAATLLAGVWAYYGGALTGAYPTDRVEQARWKSQHKQAVSFRVGEISVPLALLPPVVGFPLTLIAIMGDLSQREPDPDVPYWEDRVERVSAVLGQWAGDIPGFRGLYETLDVIIKTLQGGGNAAFDRWAASKIALAAPFAASWRAAVPVVDPYERAPQGIGQNVQGRFPSLSTDLPIARGGLGEPLTRPATGADALSPVRATTELPLDDVYALFDELGVRYTGTGDTIGESSPGEPIKLTREEAERYQEIAGPLVKEGVTWRRSTAAYKGEPDPLVRQKQMDSSVAKATKEGRKRFTQEAVQKALDSGDEAAIIRAFQMYRSQADVVALGKLVRFMVSSGRLTESMARTLDETRPATAEGRAPTIAQLFVGGR